MFKNLPLLIFLSFAVLTFVFFGILKNMENRSLAQDAPPSIKLGTFEIPTEPVYPTAPGSTPFTRPTSPASNTPATGLITGGPVNPNDPYYCIDDEDPDGCDDNTAFWVACSPFTEA